jgi:hypothetical protein
MSSNPWLILGAFAVAAYIFKLWLSDYRTQLEGKDVPGGFPGATPSTKVWIFVGIIGAIALTGLETAGEYALGVVSEQSTLPLVALFSLIAAAFGEELVFRGFVFYDRKGIRFLWLSILGASLVFALLHYQYYTTETEDGGWEFLLTPKAAWSLLLLFLNSLWFYYLRFSSRNPQRSLIPCFAAHLASNLTVFGIKLAQGYVVLS